MLGDSWHKLIKEVGGKGHKCAQAASCHVRALLYPLQKQLKAGNVSKAIYILREIQGLEKASCDFQECPASFQFCGSSKDLVSIIGQMTKTCNFTPVLKLIEMSVSPVAQAVFAQIPHCLNPNAKT